MRLNCIRYSAIKNAIQINLIEFNCVCHFCTFCGRNKKDKISINIYRALWPRSTQRAHLYKHIQKPISNASNTDVDNSLHNKFVRLVFRAEDQTRLGRARPAHSHNESK